MVASVQSVDIEQIKEAQKADRFARQMSEYLLTEELPEDELEILRVMTHAPFYQMSDDTLIRIGKGKELVGTVEGETVYGPPVKGISV